MSGGETAVREEGAVGVNERLLLLLCLVLHGVLVAAHSSDTREAGITASGRLRVLLSGSGSSNNACLRRAERRDATTTVAPSPRLVKIPEQNGNLHARQPAPLLKQGVHAIRLGVLRCAKVNPHWQVGTSDERVHRPRGRTTTNDDANCTARSVHARQLVHEMNMQVAMHEQHRGRRVHAHATVHVKAIDEVATKHVPRLILGLSENPRVGDEARLCDSDDVEVAVSSPRSERQLVLRLPQLLFTVDRSHTNRFVLPIACRWVHPPRATAFQRRPTKRPCVIRGSIGGGGIIMVQARDGCSERRHPVGNPAAIEIVFINAGCTVKGSTALQHGR